MDPVFLLLIIFMLKFSFVFSLSDNRRQTKLTARQTFQHMLSFTLLCQIV